MTGWQSGDGGQGDWDQNQSFGPEARTNRYGADPYAAPYSGDPQANPYANPYAEQRYGADPYPSGPYPGPNPTQQYPYPQTGGFPAPGFGPPPPPRRRSKLPMVLSLVAVLIIIGAVVAIVLVNRDNPQPVAQEGDQSTTSAPETTSKSSKPAPTTSEGGGGGGDRADWLTVDNTEDSGLVYQVPPDWKTSDAPRTSGLEVSFTGAADYGQYRCEGGDYVRTFAASGDVQGKNGQDLDIATTMEDFATSFATTYYGADAQADVPTPTEVTIGDKKGMTLTAKVTQNVTKPNCQAGEGEIAIVAVPVGAEGQPAGVAMLVVVNDLNGGPSDPKALDPSVTQEILKTVRVG